MNLYLKLAPAMLDYPIDWSQDFMDVSALKQTEPQLSF